MKTILYIAPHLSTGGLPQYLYKKIKSLIKTEDLHIHLIEWSDITGGILTVQRDRLRKLLCKPYQFKTLGEDKTALFTLINKINPDIIHLEEIPELFMDFDIAIDLYNPNRKYSIVETSHDSSFNLDNKLFFPDKFMMVSQFQVNKYKTLNIPTILVEYPIEFKTKPNRKKALEKLGLDPNKKHVLNVGLFTPRKNQKEFFDYARSLSEYEFHCVGNQASNFKHYWEPLMENKPDNVTWWGERRDVDNFYKCMDLFLFTSEGNEGDKETMPLVLKEALSWNMNILLYNLPVYLNYFAKYDNIFYLDSNKKSRNLSKIKTLLGDDPIIDKNKPIFILSTFPQTESIINTTKECIKAIKSKGYDIILTSHHPIPTELQQTSDYCVYDKNNILTKHTFYKHSWYSIPGEWKAHINLEGEDNDLYHGPTVYTNYYNGAHLAKSLGYKEAYFLNYDYILKDDNLLKDLEDPIKSEYGTFGKCNAEEGPSLYTYFFKSNIDFFIEHFPQIKNAEEYENLVKRYSSESNGLENLYYNILKKRSVLDKIEIIPQKEFENISKNTFIHKDYSQVEYITILPTNEELTFTPFIQISNSQDSRIVEVQILKNNHIIPSKNESFEVNGKFVYYKLLTFLNKKDIFDINITIKNTQGDILKERKFKIDINYFENQLSKNGEFNLLKKPIRLTHLLTDPCNNPKEKISQKNLSKFCKKYNIEYHPQINVIYKNLPPSESCARPEDIAMEPGYMKLSPGHYGCYMAHKNALLNINSNSSQTHIIFEGDIIIDNEEFINEINNWVEIAKTHNLDFIGFGNPPSGKYLEKDIQLNKLIPAQSYLVNPKKIEEIHKKIEKSKWDAYDLWVSNNFKTAVADKIYTKHLPGFSIVDQKYKDKNNDNPLIFKE